MLTHTQKCLALVAGLVLALAVVGVVPAHAQPIPGDLALTGSITYDTGNSFSDPGASHSGTTSLTLGGATSSTTFANGTPTGANPLQGTLTDTGDGFGVAGTASASWPGSQAEFLAGVDLLLNLTNSSAIHTYDVTIGITFDNRVDASGPDAYADSAFTIDQDTVEVFFTDITSDTVNGDELNGVDQGTSGAVMSDIGTDSLTVALGPGASVVIDGAWTLEGGVFASGSSCSGDFTGAVTIDGVVPEPGTAALLAIGCAGLARVARRRKKRS